MSSIWGEMSRYALLGRRSGELLTYGGRVLVHNDRAEMEYLFPNTDKARVIRITDGDLGQPTMPISEHPSLRSIKWPLERGDFVHR